MSELLRYIAYLSCMVKWDLPPEEPPFWLDKNCELRTDAALAPMTEGEFVLRCFDEILLVEPDITPSANFELVANAVVETGWGHYRRGNNLGGWKITKQSAGPGVPWFRARGNKAPGATPNDYKGGDPPWCYYRVFASFGAYFEQWLRRFVPKPGSVPRDHRYRKCGEEFWAGRPWFDDICQAGYKGENTKARPDRSIKDHASLSEKLVCFWVQRAIGATPDGDFGPKSSEALRAFAASHGFKADGSWSREVAAEVFHAVNPGDGEELLEWLSKPRIELKGEAKKPEEKKPEEKKPASR